MCSTKLVLKAKLAKKSVRLGLKWEEKFKTNGLTSHRLVDFVAWFARLLMKENKRTDKRFRQNIKELGVFRLSRKQ